MNEQHRGLLASLQGIINLCLVDNKDPDIASEGKIWLSQIKCPFTTLELILGQLVVAILQSILENIDSVSQETCSHLKLKTIALIRHLQLFKESQHWADVINFQFQDLKKFFQSNESSDSTPIKSQGNYDTTPSETYQPFSPLVDEYSKISCHVPKCRGRFAHKRSYEYHVNTQHGLQGFAPDPTVRDPLGTCRLISHKTRKECGTKLPLK